MGNALRQPVGQADYLKELKNVSARLAAIFERHWIRYPQMPASAVAAFSLLEPVRQADIVRQLEFFEHICVRCESMSYGLVDDKRLTWYALQRLGLRPPGDLFEKIDDADCVEIYNAENIQIFRNFNFCKITSYSLEEILIHPWYELFDREKSVLEVMQKTAGHALMGARDPFPAAIPPHTCNEVKTPDLNPIEVTFKWISPLYSSDKSVGTFLATSSLRKPPKS